MKRLVNPVLFVMLAVLLAAVGIIVHGYFISKEMETQVAELNLKAEKPQAQVKAAPPANVEEPLIIKADKETTPKAVDSTRIETVFASSSLIAAVKEKKETSKSFKWDHNSVVDFLKSQERPSSLKDRDPLYFEAGGQGEYIGTAQQNIFLLAFLKKGNFETPSVIQVKEEKTPSTEEVIASFPSRDLSAAEVAFFVNSPFESVKKDQKDEEKEIKTASIGEEVKENVLPVATASVEFVTYDVLGPVILAKEAEFQEFTILGTVAEVLGSPDDRVNSSEKPDLVILGDELIPPSRPLRENTPGKGGG